MKFTEEELVNALKEGNEAAFRYLMDEQGQKVFRTCMGFLHNREDAEDVSQDVFIEVFRSVKKFQAKSALSSWIYRITVNKSLNFVQQKQKRGFILSVKEALGLLPQAQTQENPENRLEQKEEQQRLIKAIDALPEKQRIAFVLAKYDELPYKEIAEIMETSLSSVESLLHRAKQNLGNLLKNS